MSEHLSTLQLAAAAVLALAMAVWIVGLVRLLRGPLMGRPATRSRRRALGAVPRQRQAPPALEHVELTPAERDAFAGLVRRLGESRS